AEHSLDVLDSCDGVVSALPAVVKALIRERVAVQAARGVLLVDRELDAVRRRLAPGGTYREVRADLDRPLVPARAAAATTAGESDHKRHREDYKSPSSNHRFPLVLVGRQMRKPHLTPPITCRPLPNSRRGESAPAASAATWDGRTTTPRHTIDS